LSRGIIVYRRSFLIFLASRKQAGGGEAKLKSAGIAYFLLTHPLSAINGGDKLVLKINTRIIIPILK